MADLLGDVVTPVQISPEVAEGIASALRATNTEAEQRRTASFQQLDQRRRVVVNKLDRGYDDYVSRNISDEFWTRKSLSTGPSTASSPSTPNGPVSSSRICRRP